MARKPTIRLKHDKLGRETTVATERCAQLMARSGWRRLDPQPTKTVPAPKVDQTKADTAA